MDFLDKLWNGEYRLVETYWLYGVLVNAVAELLIENTFGFLSGILLLLTIAYSVMACVGIWHAADKYTGNQVWPFLAKAHVVIVFIVYTVKLFSIFA